MNIIQKIRTILNEFPKISEVCNELHVDFTEPNPESYGLSSLGDKLLKEDITGGQQRQHNFMLYSVFSGINDYERLLNSEILLELTQWLENQKGADIEYSIENSIRKGIITKITAENGMIYSVPQENETGGLMYQLQISIEYKIESEEL